MKNHREGIANINRAFKIDFLKNQNCTLLVRLKGKQLCGFKTSIDDYPHLQLSQIAIGPGKTDEENSKISYGKDQQYLEYGYDKIDKRPFKIEKDPNSQAISFFYPDDGQKIIVA